MQQKNTSPIKQVSNVIYITGVFGLIFGILHLVTYFSSGTVTSLYDAGFNALFGSLQVLAAWLISKGNKFAVLVLSVAFLGSLAYGYLVGRGFNFFYLLISAFLVAWVMYFWIRGGFK